jgi:hypothetical protein
MREHVAVLEMEFPAHIKTTFISTWLSLFPQLCNNQKLAHHSGTISQRTLCHAQSEMGTCLWWG